MLALSTYYFPWKKPSIELLKPEETNMRWLKEPILLKRKGSRLMGGNQIWFMHNIREIDAPEAMETVRDYFQIETHLGEELVVYQKNGHTGMKEVFLIAVSIK